MLDKLNYMFFHIRPLLMVIVFPFCMAMFDMPNLTYISGYFLQGIFLILFGSLIFIPPHWAVYKPSQWTESAIIFLRAEPNNLVTNGMYGYIRNPMLMGIYLILIGEILISKSLLLLIYFITVFIASVIISIVVEEKQLIKRYGNPYINYKNRVKRFLPKIL